MEKLPHTPSQTIGPFFAYSLTAEQYGYQFNSIVSGSLINDAKDEEPIFITGNIFDGAGNVIHDAMIELWHADTKGNYHTQFKTDDFTGFGRLGTGTENNKSFTFKTIKPGQVNNQAPHINIILFMRGSLHALYTRLYFADEQNEKDSLLNAIDADRRNTLLAHKKNTTEKIVYEFNIYMQGENETVFFDVH
jgi:protocatechuate 3,4-dioxygenase, alpha subunit